MHKSKKNNKKKRHQFSTDDAGVLIFRSVSGGHRDFWMYAVHLWKLFISFMSYGRLILWRLNTDLPDLQNLNDESSLSVRALLYTLGATVVVHSFIARAPDPKHKDKAVCDDIKQRKAANIHNWDTVPAGWLLNQLPVILLSSDRIG